MRSGVFCTCVACWAVSAADGMPPAWPAGCIFGGGKDFRLYFDVKINCITFAGVSVSRSRPGRSGNQKGNGWDARTVPAAVCSSAARRDCGAALFNHWSCGTGKVPPPERVRRPADAEPCAHACGERAGAKQGLFRSRVVMRGPPPRGADSAAGVLRPHKGLLRRRGRKVYGGVYGEMDGGMCADVCGGEKCLT